MFDHLIHIHQQFKQRTIGIELQAALLRNGVYYDQKAIEEKAKSKPYPQTPLSFTELCTFNTWFVLHPEKVCGQEVITTSKSSQLRFKEIKHKYSPPSKNNKAIPS